MKNKKSKEQISTLEESVMEKETERVVTEPIVNDSMSAEDNIKPEKKTSKNITQKNKPSKNESLKKENDHKEDGNEKIENENHNFEMLSDKKNIEKFSTDASIFKIKPKGIFVPKNKQEIIDIVKEVIATKHKSKNKVVLQSENINSENISITSRGAGTCMSAGSLTDQYIISFTEHIDKIIGIDVNNKTIEVEPGVFYRDMERETLKYNLIYPSYPASRELCSVGGIVSNNSGGEKTLKYGKTEDYVEEIEMICSDGKLYNFKENKGGELDKILKQDKTLYGDLHRNILKLITENEKEIDNNRPKVSKNSSGYYLWNVYDKKIHSMNLSKLICGSQGTLGVMTKFKLRLVDHEKKSKMAVVFLKDTKYMPQVVNDMLALNPESCEIYDDHTFKIAMKFLPDIFKRLGGSLFSLGLLFWPEIKMLLSGNIPKIIMLVEFTEKDNLILYEKIHHLRELFKNIRNDESLHKNIKTHIVETQKEARKYWVFRRESFNLLRSKLKAERTVPFIEDIVIRSSELHNFLPKFEKILDTGKFTYTIAGHVGDGNIHVIPLMKLSDEKNIDLIEKVSNEVYELVKDYGGSLSGEHNDGLIRAPFLHYMFTDKMLNLFTEVKKIFDPENIFNPNKKININWEYAKERIDRSK